MKDSSPSNFLPSAEAFVARRTVEKRVGDEDEASSSEGPFWGWLTGVEGDAIATQKSCLESTDYAVVVDVSDILFIARTTPVQPPFT